MKWHEIPITGAPDGKTSRGCRHDGAFGLVRAFHGIAIYQCLTCRKCSEVETRTAKTCLNCGKHLTGRQSNWCCGEHGAEFANAKSRQAWSSTVKRRDKWTCQRCGWREDKESKETFEALKRDLWQVEMKKPWRERRSGNSIHQEAARMVDYRQLEAHHIEPLGFGGAEFDLANGTTLCNLCHDQVHRELNAGRRKRRGT